MLVGLDRVERLWLETVDGVAHFAVESHFARRRATVASKITGKVIEVSLEEGQRVESGQIIARLDDSNARAALRIDWVRLSSAGSA